MSSLVLVLINYPDIAGSLPLHLYLPILMFVLALLMISRLRFPKTGLRKSKLFNAFQIVMIAGVYYCGITRSWPEFLFAMAIIVMISGIIAGRLTRNA